MIDIARVCLNENGEEECNNWNIEAVEKRRRFGHKPADLLEYSCTNAENNDGLSSNLAGVSYSLAQPNTFTTPPHSLQN